MIVFFIRRYNDIDHMVPVIYKLASTGVPARVLSLEPLLDLAGDYRLRFLRERFGVSVEHVYTAYAPTWSHRLVARFLCGAVVRRASGRRLRQLLRERRDASRAWWLELALMPILMIYKSWLFAWLYERLWKRVLYTPAWADGLVDRVRPSLLVFDWVPKRKFMIAALLEAARARGITCVALPHGVHVISDELRAEVAHRAGHVKRTWPLQVYDAVAVPEPLFRGFLVKAGVTAERVEVLGSPRYCDEWERVHDSMAPPSRIPPGLGAGRLKVVYMDKSFRSRMHPAAVVDTLRALGNLPDVTLVIKPETRGNTPASREMAQFAFIATDIPSLDLIRWADVVMGVQSSILLEVLVQGKILLYPKFFSDNVTFFEDYGACWLINSPEEAIGAIRRLREQPGLQPYPRDHADRLIADVVYGGSGDRDVLGRYRQFLLRHAGADATAGAQPVSRFA